MSRTWTFNDKTVESRANVVSHYGLCDASDRVKQAGEKKGTRLSGLVIAMICEKPRPKRVYSGVDLSILACLGCDAESPAGVLTKRKNQILIAGWEG